MSEKSGVWMTYPEAAQRLGIKEASVKRQARARHWPRRMGNDNRASVLIPADRLTEASPGSILPEKADDSSARIAAAEARAATLAEEVLDLRAERDRLLTIIERSTALERTQEPSPKPRAVITGGEAAGRLRRALDALRGR